MAESLGHFDLFGSLSSATLAALASAAHRRTWGAGQLIFQRGDTGDHMLAITAGRVRLSLATAQGRELMLRQLGPGEVLGELAIIDGEPRSADAVAVEPTSAIVLLRRPVLEVAEMRPDLGLALARHLCAMVRSTNLQMESIALYDLRMRLIRFLLFSLAQVYGPHPPDEAALATRLNQSDLSAVLGASRPKVNQALQSLIAEGALRREGGGLTCVVPRLRILAEQNEMKG